MKRLDYDVERVELASTIGDSTLAQVIGCEFDLDLVSGQDAYVIFAHFSGNMCCNNVPILQFYAKVVLGSVSTTSPSISI